MRFKLSYIASSAMKSVFKSFLIYVYTFIGNAALDVLLYMLISSVLALPYILAQILSYTVSALNRYFAYKFIKFKGRPGTGEFIKFAVLNVVVLIFSAELLALFYSVVGLPQILSKLMVTIITFSINTFFYSRVIFSAS